MLIISTATLDMKTMQWVSVEGFYYTGPVAQCCCSGDSTEKGTETSMSSLATTLQTAFSTAFGEQQSLLKGLTGTLQNMVTNPHGFDPKTLASMRTTATDTAATSFAHAATAANAYSASHGGSDLGSGVSAQISGQVGAAAAAQDSQSQNQISIANGMLQNQNYWQGISGLQTVASMENPTQYSNSAASSANASTNAGQAYLASQQAGWQDTFGVINGIAGLAMAGTGIAGALPGAVDMSGLPANGAIPGISGGGFPSSLAPGPVSNPLPQ